LRRSCCWLSAADYCRQPKIPSATPEGAVGYAKNNPGKLNAGTVGHGSQAHITLELINNRLPRSFMFLYRIATRAAA